MKLSISFKGRFYSRNAPDRRVKFYSDLRGTLTSARSEPNSVYTNCQTPSPPPNLRLEFCQGYEMKYAFVLIDPESIT